MCNNVHGVLQVNINEGEETKMITMVKTRNSAACTKLFALSQTQRRVLTNYLMLCSHNVSIFFFCFREGEATLQIYDFNSAICKSE